MKRETKKKIFIGVIIGLMICSVLSMLAQFGIATQDDEDINVSLHGTLQSNSGEVYSNLMPIGTYDFFNEPELDIGTFSHDDTRIDVSNIQSAVYNNSDPFSYNKTHGYTGNFTIDCPSIAENYTLSAPFDSTIQVNITFSRNYSAFSEYFGSYNIGNSIPNVDIATGVSGNDDYYFVTNPKAGYPGIGDGRVYRFNKDWTSASSYDMVDYGAGIEFDGTYFYIVDWWNDDVYKYTSTFSYVQSYSSTSHSYGICWDGTYFYITTYDQNKVVKYTSSFNFVETINLDHSGYGIEFDGTYFYINYGHVYRYDSDFDPSSKVDLGSKGGGRGLHYNGTDFYVCVQGAGSDDDYIYHYGGNKLFDSVYVSNFTYEKLGIEYKENYTLSYDESNSNISSTTGWIVYYFDSSFFEEYDYVNDIFVPEQNLTLIFDCQVENAGINMSIVISWSSTAWKVPTEVDLTINENSIIDETFNSGWISLSEYPQSLEITATESIYFRLNITVEFSFSFTLSVISKTYLRRRFELESDHEITLDQIILDDDLSIKKIYLNNIDYGSSNPCSVSVSMDTGNEFTLEVLLIDEIYLPLSYLYNNLGSGTANIYLSCISNTLTYSNINGNQLYSLIVPDGWFVEEGYLTFSNLDYTPDYTPNYADDESGYGYGSSSYGDEDVSWGERYYQTNANGSKVAESGNSGYESVWTEYFNTLNGYMSHTYGDLDGLNSTYTVNDYLYMQNLFPSNFTFEQWSSWVLTYNSDFTSSSWDDTNIELLSELNTYFDYFPALSGNFSMTNGTATHGDYSSIDDNYGNFTSEGGTDGEYLVFSDDFNDASRHVDWTDDANSGSITEEDNVLKLEAGTSVCDWYESVANAPKCYIDTSSKYTQSDWGVRVYISSPSEPTYRHFYGLVLYEDDQNAWFFGHYENEVYTNNIMVEKIVSNSYTSYIDHTSSTDPYLRIQNISGTFYFDYSSDGSSWTNAYSSASLGIDVDYVGLFHKSWSSASSLTVHFDDFEMYENRTGTGGTISFTVETSFNLDNLMGNETLDHVRLYYSYYTNESFEFTSYIYNFDTTLYEILNQSTNNDGFHEIYLTLNSSFYNHSYYTIRLRFNSTHTDSYQLHLDQLCIVVQRTKTSGEIYASLDKYLSFSILNRYDSEGNYQDLYNVTIEFLYCYSNYTHYSEFAQLDYYNSSYTLTKDEAWHEASLNFEFNSSDINSFNLLFNITNGLLEIKNLNYTIFFECLDTNNRNTIYQRFRYIPSLSLNDLQRVRGNWILNFTYNFTASSDLDYYSFYNSFNYSLLSFQIYVNDESGWEAPVSYDYNATQSNIAFTFNITQYISECGALEFNDFYLEFYLAGNPSEFELDDLLLFDFDSEFYEVNALWISDTLVISHQNISLFWKASDRYISHVEINETYDSNTMLIYNITLINNTLQSIEYYNITAGFYSLNLTFYDTYDNWERWELNFTIISSISISVGYENPIFINSNNTIEIHILSEYSITQIYYHNSTNNHLYYDNSSYPLYEIEFNFTLNYSVETVYDISVLVISEYNDSFCCNITQLSVIERTTLLDFLNLHYSYYQDEMMNITFILKDLYNNPLSSEPLNYTIEDPLGFIITNSSGITDANGEVNYILNFSISQEIGFYHLNCSYSGTTQYTSVWKLQSFQVRPISRSVNSTDINLKVNGHNVINNYIQINFTNNFTLSNNNTATFDMSIYLNMNYTESITYNQYLSYSYSYSATSDITSLTFSVANLTSYPSNFTNYYYNLAESTNYVRYSNNFTINDLVGDTLYNDNSFSIRFTYLDTTEIERIQLTSIPRTDTDEVQFKEYLTANRTFSYWYFHNSLNITTVSLYHNRTSSTIDYTDFTIENSNYYFEQSCLSGDLFTTTTTYNPGWVVSYEILTQNGTYSEIQISYKASLDISNVTLVLNLNDDNLYAENWSHNGEQSLYTFILEIPNLNFTTSTQTLTINGNSSVPYASIAYFENEEDYDFSENDYDDDNMAIWYRAYLEFPYFSQSFIIQGRNASWVLDGIHYADDEYDITPTGYFENPGWGSGISSAYLRFYAHPIGRVARYVNYNPETTEVVYRINTLLDIQNAEFEFYIENDEAYTIIDIYFEGDEVDHDEYEQVKLGKIDEKDYYRLLNIDLERGVNKIHIKYREEHLEYHSWILFIAIALTIGFLGFYAWKLNVLIKSKKGKRLSRSDIIRLIIMPWRIKSEKVDKRRKKNELKGSARRTWSELKEDYAKLKKKRKKKKSK